MYMVIILVQVGYVYSPCTSTSHDKYSHCTSTSCDIYIVIVLVQVATFM